MKNNQQYKSKQKQTKNLIPFVFHGFPVDFSGKKKNSKNVKRNKKNLSEWVGMGTTKCYKKAECSTKKTTRGQENHFVFFILSAKALWPPPFLAGSFAACLTPISRPPSSSASAVETKLQHKIQKTIFKSKQNGLKGHSS